jgi:sodium/potassium-transporting ATPase subunit alpha
LCAIVAAQVVNLFLCRSEDHSAFALMRVRNPWLLAGLAAEIVLIALIVYTPWGNALFGTAPLPAAAWLPGVPVALTMLAADEARKAWLRRRSASGPAPAEAESDREYPQAGVPRSPGWTSTQDRPKASNPASR